LRTTGRLASAADRGDRSRIDLLQRLGEIRSIGLGMRNLLRQPYRQRRLSFVGAAGFEGVKIFGHICSTLIREG
jgi:hypothetical protein